MASAAPYVQRGLSAQPLARFSITVAPSATVVVDVHPIASGADPIAHLFDTTAFEEVAYDDDSGAGLGAHLKFKNPTSATRKYELIVRAYDVKTEGQVDVYVDGANWGRVYAYGERVAVPSGTLTYEAVLRTSGTNNPLLLGLGCDAERHLVARDDDSGVGLGASFRESGVCWVMMGRTSNGSVGGADLIVNDISFTATGECADADGDCLGPALEVELGTCPDAPCVDPNFSVPAWDTDRDGIADSDEVFGVDASPVPQYLPRWGADPLHKDIFVELDEMSDLACSPTLAVSQIQQFQLDLNAGPVTHLRNPNGVGGVSLHVDTGIDPTDPAERTLYGDWGGHNIVDAEARAGLSRTQIRDSEMDPVRRGIFRYALARPGSGGQSGADALEYGACNGPTFRHELGHTLGIQHAGHPNLGPVNCKPQYVSIMNYAYSPDVGFYVDEGGPVLNPSDARESYGLGTTDNAFLAGWPRSYFISGQAVDWNWDGLFTGTTAVRGPLAWNPTLGHPGCRTFVQNWTTLYAQSTKTDGARAATPSLVRRGNRLYVFWVRLDGQIAYVQGELGFPWTSDCESDILGESCLTWSPVQTVITTYSVRALSAVLWDDDTVVLGHTVDSTTAPRIQILHSSTIDAAGNLTGWSTGPSVSNGYTQVEPELAVLDVDPAVYGTSPVLATLYRYDLDDTYRWATTTAPTSSWTSRSYLRDELNNIIRGAEVGPTVATVPGGPGPDQHCVALADTNSKAALHCLDRSAGRWGRYTATALPSPPPEVTGKPGFVYHVLRNDDGTWLEDPTYGRFQLVTVPGNAAARAWLSRPLDASMSAGPSLDFRTAHDGTVWNRSYYGNRWFKVRTGTGVALLETGTSIKAARIDPRAVNDATTFYDVVFDPLADGAINVALEVDSDFRVMERGICFEMLASDARCGDETTSPWGY